jgi:hypothetical protein
MMYDYEKEALPLNMRVLLPNIELKQDFLPTQHPYVPRLCKERGHFLIWNGNKNDDLDLYNDSQKFKYESQWLTSNNIENVELGIALLYDYNYELIVGSLKTANYMNRRTSAQIRSFIRKMWNDIILMFGDRKIICPAGSLFEYYHLTMNQKRIPHDVYHHDIMKQFGFKRVNDYWVRDGFNN